jgi:voltage-gated potassium channel Kch
MSSLLLLFSAFYGLWDLLKQPKYRAVVIWIGFILLAGTIFYRQVEGWSWLDSLYFSLITLSTVGYGDISPSTPASKIFTMVYIFLGMSLVASFAGMLVKERGEMHKQRLEKAKVKKDE